MAPYPYAPEDGAKYVLLSPDGSRAVFNDDNDVDACDINTSATGLDSPDVTASSDLLVGADGGYIGQQFYGMRPITLNGTVYNFATVAARNVKLDKIRRATNAMLADGSLSFTPAWRQTQLLTNPGAEYGTAGWTYSGNGSFTTQTTWHLSPGVTGFQYTGTTSAAQQFVGIAQQNIPVVANTKYNVVVPLIVSSGARSTLQPYAQVTFYDKTNTAVGTQITSFATAGISTAQSIVATGSSPATAVSASFAVYIRELSGYGTFTMQFDNLVFSADFATYTDGDQPGQYWAGVPGLSTSGNYVPMFTTFRRQSPVRFSGQYAKTFQVAIYSQYAPLFSAALIYSNYSTANAALIGTPVPSGSQVQIENYGNYPAYPLLLVSGTTSASFTVNNVTDGTYVGISGSPGVGTGQTLTIDVLNHTATLSTGASWNQYIDFANSTWPRVTPNAKSNWSTSSGSLVVQYRHAWV